MDAIFANQPDLLEQVRVCIENGANLNWMSKYGESPLRIAANRGRFDVVGLLLASGADKSQLAWSGSIEQTVFGTLDSLRASLLAHNDLEVGDRFARTPLMFAILSGDIAKVSLLLELGANRDVADRAGTPAAAMAIERDDAAMLAWLADQGFDMEARGFYQQTLLITAAEAGKTACARFLVEFGVDIFKSDQGDSRALNKCNSYDIARILIAAGDDVNGMTDQARAGMLGIGWHGPLSVGAQAYRAGRHRRFGVANPDRIDEPFWLDMVKSGALAYSARKIFDDQDMSAPVWNYGRYGRTTTVLPDGRIIEIGGEHEDSYDPEFCIYNDVTVFDGMGGVVILSYPPDVFPPTDFHTATLVGNVIYVIGCLGYADARRPADTPVFKLDLASYRFEEVHTSGDCPGWISGHKARLDHDNGIIVTGEKQHRLCLTTKVWRQIQPASPV